MSSSVHIDNKWIDILILGEGPTQRLDDTTLIAEANMLLVLHNNNNKKKICIKSAL